MPAEKLEVVYHVSTGCCDIVIVHADRRETFATVSNIAVAKKVVELLQKGELEKAKKAAKPVEESE